MCNGAECWQGQFASFVIDDEYLVDSAHYVELNPVQARMVRSPADYPWSSAAAHLRGQDDYFGARGSLAGVSS
jgi:putative transposase